MKSANSKTSAKSFHNDLEITTKLPFLLQPHDFARGCVSPPRHIFPIYAFVVLPCPARNHGVSRRKRIIERFLIYQNTIPCAGWCSLFLYRLSLVGSYLLTDTMQWLSVDKLERTIHKSCVSVASVFSCYGDASLAHSRT